MMRQGRVYWTAAESHYYSEPKRLERLGYLESEKQPGKTRERTHYRLTGKGRHALAAWMAQPAGFPRIQNEAVVRVLAGDLVDDRVLLESLQGLRAEIEDLRSRLDTAEEIAATLPHRERYLRLVQSLGRRMLTVHEEWLAEVEEELG
jgi:DNA-binding PadR family transcriptional regulator